MSRHAEEGFGKLMLAVGIAALAVIVVLAAKAQGLW